MMKFRNDSRGIVMEFSLLNMCFKISRRPPQNKKIKLQGEKMDVADQSMGGIYFQEEILMDIISRLPLRSLYRFKCVSKFWETLISDPSFGMKTKLSPVELGYCTENILHYLFHLVVGVYKDRKTDSKEYFDQQMPEILGCDFESDEHPSDDDNSDEDDEDDSEYESSDSDEYDSEEEVDDVESGDGSADADSDAADGEKGKLSAKEKANRRNNKLFYTLYLVPLFEEMYEDRKADLKEIQEKHPLPRLVRELLGYDSGSNVRPSEDDSTKDERAVAEEHDSKKVDAAKSGNGSGR